MIVVNNTNNSNVNPLFVQLLDVEANKATCAKYKVAALLVGLNTEHIYGVGRNGAPAGIVHCSEMQTLVDYIVRNNLNANEIKYTNVYTLYIELPLELKGLRGLEKLLAKFPTLTKPELINLFKLYSKGVDIPDANKFEDLLILTFPELDRYNPKDIAKALTLVDTYDLNKELFKKQIELLNYYRQKGSLKDVYEQNPYKLNYVHSKLEFHAERNLLNHMNYNLLANINEPLALYITHTPCFDCFKELFQKLGNKLKVVYYKNVYYHTPYIQLYGSELKEFTQTVDLFKAMGVKVEQI